ncbi:fibronectin type III domain-containing protein [Pseudomonas sp. NPDC089569]|uniref:fibronectin type III domain-containing protein n=1 Tax=Pseudomonas sp. NPDC089569 TaxID=3390722 RepID=UPI003CFE7201
MSNDQIDTSDSTEASSPEDIAPQTNYSRWMTDMAADIAYLTLYQMAIPGAHNSGVDMAGTWGPWELLAACQNKTFPDQLAAGARYLDLRLEDRSYWKMVGNKVPRRVFFERLEFTHGNGDFWGDVSAGRTLQYLVSEVKKFAERNPGEIIILDFRKFKKNMADSLERAFPYLTPIKHLLIPESSKNLPIAEIRKKHPGRNITLCFDHGLPKNWKPEWVQRDQLWKSIRHVWSTDQSESSTLNLVKNAMRSPPLNSYWALSATVRNSAGPKHLGSDNPIRTEVFKAGQQNANIVLVDFIERSETVSSVTDKCIELNRQRASAIKQPLPPTNLVAAVVEGENTHNTIEFQWTRTETHSGIRTYEVFNGNSLLFTANGTTHREKNLPLRNYNFKVRSVNPEGQRSDFSAPFTLIQDIIPPTVPENFEISNIGPSYATFNWEASYDNVGIEGYELTCGNQSPIFTNKLTTTVRNLTTNTTYKCRLRAKDVNGLYSEYTDIEHLNPLEFTNPRLELQQIEEPGAFIGYLTWDLIESPYLQNVHYIFTVNGQLSMFVPEIGIAPRCFLHQAFGSPVTVKSWILYPNGEIGKISTHTFTCDPTPPSPAKELKLTSRTPNVTSVSWTPPTGRNIAYQSISLNEAPPQLIPASAHTHAFEKLPTYENFLIEIWATNDMDIQSTVESITLDAIEVGAPSNFRYKFEQSKHILEWDAPSNTEGITGYKYSLTDPQGLTVNGGTAGPQMSPFLIRKGRYSIELRSVSAKGESRPLLAEFIVV